MARYYDVPRLCGIYYIPTHITVYTPSWLPQVSLSTEAQICDTASRTRLTQTFVNPSKNSAIARAKYTFPLYESCAVVSFRCFVGDRLIEGIVKEKEEAKQEYKEAVERGETAGLLERHTPDVFSTSIGNIPAGATVRVEIAYIMELKHDAEVDGLRFTIPTSIAPRYGDAPSGITTSWDGQPVSGAQGKGGMKISVQVVMPSVIRSVQSPSHNIAVHLGGCVENVPDDAYNPKLALTTLTQTSTELAADFVLLVKCADLSSPRALLETHPTIPDSKALMVTLVPKFTLLSGPQPEIVFVVDRSGSMEDRMNALRSSLAVFLKSLPLGVKFNICSFGSNHSFLWKKSQSYSESTLGQAQKHIGSMAADLGGTEILPPIKATVSQRYKDLPLDIMVLTDGEVWNTDELFKYIEQETASGDVRLFSLGIGRDVSHSLVEGMARVGRGFAQIVSDEKEGIEGKVVRMLRGALSVHIKDYRLEWEGKTSELQAQKTAPSPPPVAPKKINLFDTKAQTDAPLSGDKNRGDRFAHLPAFAVPSVIQAPYKLPPLFPFSRSTAYAIMSGDVRAPSSVWLRGTTPSGDQLELEIPVQALQDKGEAIHQLAARKVLQELEEGTSYLHSGRYGVDRVKNEGTFGDWVDREGIRVGVRYGLASKWTSIVAVEKKKKVETKRTEAAADASAAAEVESVTEVGDGDYELVEGSGDADIIALAHLADSAPGGPPMASGATRRRGGVGSRRMPIPPPQPAPASAKKLSSFLPMSMLFGKGMPAARAQSAVLAPSAGAAPKMQAPTLEARRCTTLAAEEDDEEMSFSLSLDGLSMGAAPAQGATQRDKAKALIALQTFEGSFPLTSALAAALGASLPDLETKAAEFNPSKYAVNNKKKQWDDKKKLWATALAVAMFEGTCQGEKEMWELVVEKARAWMARLVGPSDIAWLETKATEVIGGLKP